MAKSPAPRPFGSTDPPPLPPRSFVPLWTGRHTNEIGFTVLTDQLRWYPTHWTEGRVVPCTLKLGACALCRLAWTPRQRGYVTASRYQTGGVYLLQVTMNAYRECPELQEHRGKMRACQFAVRRVAHTPQAPWLWRYCGRVPAMILPSCPGVELILSRLWGINLANLSEDGPFTDDARELLQPYPEKAKKKPSSNHQRRHKDV